MIVLYLIISISSLIKLSNGIDAIPYKCGDKQKQRGVKPKVLCQLFKKFHFLIK